MDDHKAVSIMSRPVNVVRAGIRSVLRHTLSQEQRTNLKRVHGLARKRLAPVLSLVHGSFNSDELCADLERRLPSDCEIVMVHSSYENLLPMYTGSPVELLAGLAAVCGRERTLVMPAFVMGGRDFDREGYFQNRPFDVRRTPSDMGLLAEVFRRTPGVLRSLHPTCSICALGPLAGELTAGHHLARTGLGPDGPFGVMTRRRTAILGLGVEYYRCLTHAHTANDELGDAFPIKFAKGSIPVLLIDYDGRHIEYDLGLPDPSMKLDLTLLWSLLSKQELIEWRFHGVPLFAVPQAGIVTERLVEAARRGITIYGRVQANLPPHSTIQYRAKESDL
jgi:aminoglycoside N3'-acetyltransferase